MVGAPPLPLNSTNRRIAKRLADALVVGRWEPDSLVSILKKRLSRRPRKVEPLVGRLLVHFGTQAQPSSLRVIQFLLADRGFRRSCECGSFRFSNAIGSHPPPVMWPATGSPSSWQVPSIVTPSELAAFLGVGMDELEWLADRQARERRQASQSSRRYAYRWIKKRSGMGRLIESPCSRLRLVQRRVLHGLIDLIPPHHSAHGFRKNRSILTYSSPHVGRRVVVKLDLANFFPSIESGRVLAIFLTAGYPEPVARILAGLCTNTVPSSEWRRSDDFARVEHDWKSRRLYRQPHLPQGAPTSPSLANLAAYRLDARLEALAEASGAVYTRYADDLAFSGDRDFERSLAGFPSRVGAIAIEEGFSLNFRKTRVMRRGTRQIVAGVVVNAVPNTCRDAFDELKAIVWNCRKFGVESQNRDGHADFLAHLRGRIAFVESINPTRGKKLRESLEQIQS